MIRTITLRILGLLVAAALGLTAVSLVSYGLERSVPWLSDGLRSFADWARTPPLEGAAVLAGAGLVLLALAIALLVAARRIRGVRKLESTEAGSTDIDMGSVAEALETSLRVIDPKVHVTSRRSSLKIAAPPGTGDPFAVADEASGRIREALEQMGLPDTPFTVSVKRVPARRVA